jgi:phosphoglycolate phosphatase
MDTIRRIRHAPVLLDLDGTVVDSAQAIDVSVRAACSHVGVHVAADADLAFCFGPPLHESLTKLGVAEEQMSEAMRVFAEHHWERAVHLLRPMPGALRALDLFAEAGIATAIVTVKPTGSAERVLRTLGVEHLFSAVLGRTDDFDPRTKTDLLGEALVHPALGGDRPIYIGDQPSDRAAAHAHGVRYLHHPQATWRHILDAVLG